MSEYILDEYPSRPVESFIGTEENPHNYPGERPSGSFLSDGENVYSVRSGLDGLEDLDDLLNMLNDAIPEHREHRVRNIYTRYPIVAYGSNCSPKVLAKKFTDTLSEVVDMNIGAFKAVRTVPSLKGFISGYDVVWHGAPGQRSNFFADIYRGNETINTELEVDVLFLTAEQLLLLHRSESVNYELGKIGAVKLGEGFEVPAFCYVGPGLVLLKGGKPLAVEAIKARDRGLVTYTSAQALEYVLDFPEVQKVIKPIVGNGEQAVTVDEYTRKALSLELSEKKALVVKVSAELAKLGLQHQIDSSIFASLHPWANPSALPTLGQILKGTDFNNNPLRLPEQELHYSLDPYLGIDVEKSAVSPRAKALESIRQHYRKGHKLEK